MPFDIAAIFLAGQHVTAADPSFRSFINAIRSARAMGLRVQAIVHGHPADADAAALPDEFGTDEIQYLSSTSDHPAMARNAAIEAVNAAWVALLEAGDLWSFDWLTDGLAYLQSASDDVIAHAQYSFLIGDDRRILRHPDQDGFEFHLDLARLVNFWPGPGIGPVSAYRSVRYRGDGASDADWTWNLDTIAAGYRHKIVPQSIVFRHEASDPDRLPLETPLSCYGSTLYGTSSANYASPSLSDSFLDVMSEEDVSQLHMLFLGRPADDPASVKRYRSGGLAQFAGELARSAEFSRRLHRLLSDKSSTEIADPISETEMLRWVETRFSQSLLQTSQGKAHLAVLAAVLSRFPFSLAFEQAFGTRSLQLIEQLQQKAVAPDDRWAGYIDQCSSNLIKGWVLETGRSEPLTVIIKVGGLVAGVAEASIYRRDVAHILGSNGICGFEIVPVIDWNLILDPVAPVTLHDAHSGERLPFTAELGNQRRSDLRRQDDASPSATEAAAGASDGMAVRVERFESVLASQMLPLPPLAADQPHPGVSVVIDGTKLSTAELDDTLSSVAAQAHEVAEVLVVGPHGCAPLSLAEDFSVRAQTAITVIEAGTSPQDTAERMLAATTGQLLVLISDGGTVDRTAISWFAHAHQQHGARVAYADDIARPALGGHGWPELKPCFDPDLLWQHDYISGFFSVTRTDLSAALIAWKADGPISGSLGMEAYSMLLHVLAQVPESAVLHVPLVLHHKRGDATASAEQVARQRLIARRHLRHRNDGAGMRVVPAHPRLGLSERHYPHWPAPIPRKKMAIIIPTRDRVELLKPCIDSLQRMMADPASCEILIIDNGSSDPATLDYFHSLRFRTNIRVVRSDGPFNWSGLNNLAMQHTRAELLLFSNNDIEAFTEGYDDILRGLLGRPDVGVVGTLLLYPNGAIQHAGTALGIGGVADHIAAGRMPAEYGIARIANHQRSIGAVTGAFLAMRRDIFEMVGGYDDVDLKVAFSDVDLCMKVSDAGLRVIYTPQIVCLHHESASRGLDTIDPEKNARANAEIRTLQDRWGDTLATDAFFNIAYDRRAEPYTMARIPRLSTVLGDLARQASRLRPS